jgi:hypothetical protein
MIQHGHFCAVLFVDLFVSIFVLGILTLFIEMKLSI